MKMIHSRKVSVVEVKKQKDTNTCIKILNDNAISSTSKDLVFKTMVNDGLILNLLKVHSMCCLAGFGYYGDAG